MISLLTRPLAYAAVAVLGLGACGYDQGTFDLPSGGVSTTVSEIHLNDVILEGPDGIPAHASAPLRFAVTNDSDTADTLVGVSTPLAADVELREAGQAVSEIDIPAGVQKDFERHAGAVLENIDRSIAAGHRVPVTFQFAHAGTVTVHVTTGPLGSPATTRGEQR